MHNILVLGATSTVATSLSRRYLEKGSRFYFLARSADKLASRVAEFSTQLLGSEAVDFTAFDDTIRAIDRAYEVAGWFDLIVVAHGYLGDQLESERNFVEALAQISINFSSVVAQLIAVTRHLESNPGRRAQIAVITSVAADRGRPRNYTYGAAKAGLNTYLQGLRSRMWGRAWVTTIKLGPVDTPMSASHEKNALFISSEEAARQIERAITKKRAEVYVPRRFSLVMRVVRALPEPIFQRIPSLSGR
ncbi:MAG TPA: SDR family NAD(P)-dependent oxidoreductase [Polyangiaceae bacterium]|nr:SDR family NAD(P)-dependent oxidoreductase [Polyangiaceae bacterium]